MKECRLWDKLRTALRLLDFDVHATRHEDECTSGVPDTSYGGVGINGWIELKAYPEWPKRPSTTVKFSNFTPLQRRWLEDRGPTGGHCFLMAAFDKEVIVVDWSNLGAVGCTRKDELLQHCIYHAKLPLRGSDLASILFK